MIKYVYESTKEQEIGGTLLWLFPTTGFNSQRFQISLEAGLEDQLIQYARLRLETSQRLPQVSHSGRMGEKGTNQLGLLKLLVSTKEACPF